MNRPPAVAIDFGSPESDIQSTSSLEFEHVGYPDQYHHQHHRAEETLPLHYMSEEKARRRVRPGGAGGGLDADFNEKEQFEYQEYDDAGKDVYNKPRPYNGARISSGRLPAQPFPPPTSIVSVTIIILLDLIFIAGV